MGRAEPVGFTSFPRRRGPQRHGSRSLRTCRTAIRERLMSRRSPTAQRAWLVLIGVALVALTAAGAAMLSRSPGNTVLFMITLCAASALWLAAVALVRQARCRAACGSCCLSRSPCARSPSQRRRCCPATSIAMSGTAACSSPASIPIASFPTRRSLPSCATTRLPEHQPRRLRAHDLSARRRGDLRRRRRRRAWRLRHESRDGRLRPAGDGLRRRRIAR